MALNIVDIIEDQRKRVEVPEKILGKGLMMPFNATCSASRKIMFGTQQEQILALKYPEVPLVQTGYENSFGDYASSLMKADDNYEVIDKVAKFSNNPGDHFYLIVKNLNKDEYDVIERISYRHITESYGFLYNNTVLDSLQKTSVIKQGTTLQKSFAYDENNNRQDGVNLLTTYLSCEYTKEDSVIISETASRKLTAPLLKKVTIIINDNDIPLNLYGDNNTYKSFPDIGETIKQGIVCGIRRDNKKESLFAQTYNRLQDIMMSDEKFTVEGKIIDINIYCNNPTILSESYYSEQLKFYYDENMKYVKDFVDKTADIINNKKNICSHKLQKLYHNNNMVLEGKHYMKDKAFSNVILELMVLEESEVMVGDKISNRYGGKGCVSEIRPDDQMPILDNGKAIECIFNIATCVNRENAGQLFETSINQSSARLIEYIDMNVMHTSESIDLYLEYLQLLCPEQADFITSTVNRLDDDEGIQFLKSVINEDEGIMLSMKPMSEIMDIDKLSNLYKHMPFLTQYSMTVPIIDSNMNTRYITSKRKITCGKQYIYRLKQYAEEKLSATSLSTTNIKNENTRNPAKKSYKDIHTKTPIKFGEMENSNLFHLGAENAIVNLLLHSASPHGRRLSEALLTGDPFNIDIKLDDMSSNRGAEILNTYLLTMGLELKFIKVPKVKKRLATISPVQFINSCINKGTMNPIYYTNKEEYFDVAYLEKMVVSNNPMRRSPVIFLED